MSKHKEHPQDDYGDNPVQEREKPVLPDPIALARPGPEGERLRQIERLQRDMNKALRN